MVTVNHFKTADGLNLAYADEGPRDGLPILCLAGLTRNMDDFAALAARLSVSYRVIRLDSRGRGASDHASEPMTYDVPREAGDALALLNHLGLASAVFVGTSRGGLLTMVTAAIAPARIRAAILNDIGPEIAPGGLERIMDYVGKPPTAATLDALAEQLETAGHAGAPTLTRAQWREIAANVAEQTADGIAWRYDLRLRDALLAQGEALRAAIENGSRPPDLWAMFGLLAACPVLVLRGANSDILSAETLERMKAVAPDRVAIATVPDRAHVPLLDEPESVEAIDELLARVAALSTPAA